MLIEEYGVHDDLIHSILTACTEMDIDPAKFAGLVRKYVDESKVRLGRIGGGD
jgi:hypothetical protein